MNFQTILKKVLAESPPCKAIWTPKAKSFITRYKKYAKLVWQRRQEYFRILDEHFGKKDFKIEDLLKVSLVLSSSRSGSSFLMKLLGKQALSAESNETIILDTPAELRPHIISSGFYPLLRGGYSDQLDKIDYELCAEGSCEKMSTELKKELLHEIGYYLPFTTDLYGFAIQIFGRLILQWPEIKFDKLIENEIEQIYKAVTSTCQKLYKKNKSDGIVPNVYESPNIYNPETFYDTMQYQTNLMIQLQKIYPEIDLRYYDGLDAKIISVRYKDSPQIIGPSTKYIIEETPFILPRPRHFATAADIEIGVLVLKDPSIIWQLEFWQLIFSKSEIQYLHLTRNPHAVINGLIDGWNSSVGFQTHPILPPLTANISEYTDQEGSWQADYFNYSTNRRFIHLFNMPCALNITEVSALQYILAHMDILDKCKNNWNYWQIKSGLQKIGFEWILSDTVDALTAICDKIGVRATNSIISAAVNKSKYRVMVTEGTSPDAERWKIGKNFSKIREVANSSSVKDMAGRLGYLY